MYKTWGKTPGEYKRNIEQHGVDIDSIATMNMALWPVANDKCSKKLLKKCWNNRAKELFDILQPSILVAQGKKVYQILKKLKDEKEIPKNCEILEGVHQSSRKSKEEKNKKMQAVKKRLKKWRHEIPLNSLRSMRTTK